LGHRSTPFPSGQVAPRPSPSRRRPSERYIPFGPSSLIDILKANRECFSSVFFFKAYHFFPFPGCRPLFFYLPPPPHRRPFASFRWTGRVSRNNRQSPNLSPTTYTPNSLLPVSVSNVILPCPIFGEHAHSRLPTSSLFSHLFPPSRLPPVSGWCVPSLLPFFPLPPQTSITTKTPQKNTALFSSFFNIFVSEQSAEPNRRSPLFLPDVAQKAFPQWVYLTCPKMECV